MKFGDLVSATGWNDGITYFGIILDAQSCEEEAKILWNDGKTQWEKRCALQVVSDA